MDATLDKNANKLTVSILLQKKKKHAKIMLLVSEKKLQFGAIKCSSCVDVHISMYKLYIKYSSQNKLMLFMNTKLAAVTQMIRCTIV